MLSRRNQSHSIILFALTAVLLLSACTSRGSSRWQETAYGSWQFSTAEIRKLPDISLRNILSSAAVYKFEKVQILLSVQDLDGLAEVKRLSDSGDVIVTRANGQEVQVQLSRISRIQITRWIKVEPRPQTTAEIAEATAEVLAYTPLIPVAIATWPLLRALGLDEGMNANDQGKAMLAYGGLSRATLAKQLGQPTEKFYCEDNYGNYEVWLYARTRVLRGGRAIFLRSEDQKVYYTTHNTTFFRKLAGCAPL